MVTYKAAGTAGATGAIAPAAFLSIGASRGRGASRGKSALFCTINEKPSFSEDKSIIMCRKVSFIKNNHQK